jgi:stress response protein SCP2
VKKFRIVSLAVGIFLVGYTTLTFLGTAAAGTRAQTIPSKVVDDQVSQYNFAVKSGTLTDRCVQAGFVASAYIQVKDEPNREEWERIRQDDCKAAGLNR